MNLLIKGWCRTVCRGFAPAALIVTPGITLAFALAFALTMLPGLSAAQAQQPATAPTQESIVVEASAAEGGGVAVEARARVKASAGVIWATLTDYGNLARFVPGMRKSDILERQGNTVLVHQEGTARLLFLHYGIEVTVQAVEEPPDRLHIRLVRGNLKKLNGGYVIEKIAGTDDEYMLRWNGVIDPVEKFPGFFEIPLMRANMDEQFRGLVAEIARRSGAVTTMVKD